MNRCTNDKTWNKTELRSQKINVNNFFWVIPDYEVIYSKRWARACVPMALILWFVITAAATISHLFTICLFLAQLTRSATSVLLCLAGSQLHWLHASQLQNHFLLSAKTAAPFVIWQQFTIISLAKSPNPKWDILITKTQMSAYDKL